jgi:hypothetical protein
MRLPRSVLRSDAVRAMAGRLSWGLADQAWVTYAVVLNLSRRLATDPLFIGGLVGSGFVALRDGNAAEPHEQASQQAGRAGGESHQQGRARRQHGRDRSGGRPWPRP